MYYFPGEQWYAVRVKSRFEKVATGCLQGKKIPFLNLTYKVLSKRKDRKKTLTKAFFPGYLFVKSELNPDIHVEILKSIGVIDFIKNSKGPLPIPESQIENVKKLERYKGEILSFSCFTSGMAVRVVQGPLKGLEGCIDEVNRDLIKIGIDSIPGAVAVQVSPYQIEPIYPRNDSGFC